MGKTKTTLRFYSRTTHYSQVTSRSSGAAPLTFLDCIQYKSRSMRGHGYASQQSTKIFWMSSPQHRLNPIGLYAGKCNLVKKICNRKKTEQNRKSSTPSIYCTKQPVVKNMLQRQHLLWKVAQKMIRKIKQKFTTSSYPTVRKLRNMTKIQSTTYPGIEHKKFETEIKLRTLHENGILSRLLELS